MTEKKLLQLIEKAKAEKWEEFILDGEKIPVLPPQIGQLTDLMTLGLQDCDLVKLPIEIGQLENLEVLNLYNNQLTQLPKEITKLKNLNTLDLSNNQLVELPVGIIKLNKLRTLDIRNNNLPFISQSMTEMDMQILWEPYQRKTGILLSGNPLKDPPIDIVKFGTGAVKAYFFAKEKAGNGAFDFEQFKDRAYYQELLKLPPELRTAIQQYLVYFKEYVRKAKGKEIGFETCTHEEGLQLLFEKQEGEELQSIYGYFKEYLGFIEQHIDELEVVVETDLSDEEKNLLILDLRDEKRALESRIERKELENKLLSGQLERISHLFETELTHRQPTIVKMLQESTITVNIELQVQFTQQIQTDLGELRKIIEKKAPRQGKELADIQEELKDIPSTATGKDLVGPLAKVWRLLKQLAEEDSALSKIIKGSKKAARLVKQLAAAYNIIAPQLHLPPIDGLMM